MKISIQSVASAVLLAAFLLGAARPSKAQHSSPVTTGATISRGHGTLFGNGAVQHFQFIVKRQPNGVIEGYFLSIAPSQGSALRMDITSAMFADGGSSVDGNALGVAGEITMSVGQSPGYAVGRTAFFMVKDSEGGAPGPDRWAGLGQVPLSLGSLTFQEIYALIGPPPPANWQAILSGDVRTLS